MTKNRLLNIAIIVCKFFRLLYIATFLILTGLFVHYQINPSSYKNFDFTTNQDNPGLFEIATITTSSKIHVDGKVAEDSEVFVFNKLTRSSLYFNFIKFTVILLLGFLCIKEFQRVIESVKDITTFQKRNVSSFRRISKYLLIIFILMSYISYTFELGGISGFRIYFNLLILSLLAYILAEIFKEGNKLLEENKLTV